MSRGPPPTQANAARPQKVSQESPSHLSTPLPNLRQLIKQLCYQEPILDRATRQAEGVVRLQTLHWEWVQAWETLNLVSWSRTLLKAQRTWRRIERGCKINRFKLAEAVHRSTTQGGAVLWNPHHYRLDAFERKPDPPAQEGDHVDRRQSKTAEKRLFDEIERTYGKISVNMGEI